jgi:hypothetical protein
MKLIERWEAYKRIQSMSGYTFVPGDELIYRDAWNAAVEAAREECVKVSNEVLAREAQFLPAGEPRLLMQASGASAAARAVGVLREPDPYYAETKSTA